MGKRIKHCGPGVLALLFAMAAGVLAACGSDESNESSATSPAAGVRSYVGTAEGTDAFVGVVVDRSRVLGYLCDGVPGDRTGTKPTLQAWFNGPSDGAAVDVQQPGGRLQLQLTATEMTGTVTLADGRAIPVRGTKVDGDAGLYRAEAEGGAGQAVAGWILAADGQQRGGVGGLGRLGEFSGIPALNTNQLRLTFEGLAPARIVKVGTIPIPTP